MTIRADRSARRRAVAELIAHLSQVVHAMGFSGGLRPAQWAALRYFKRTNESARSLTGFVHATGITKGAASQMINALESRGLVRSIPSDLDQRRKRIDITEHGAALLASDPLNQVVAALGAVGDQELDDATRVIQVLLRQTFDVNLNNEKAEKRLKRVQKLPQTTPQT